MLTAFPSSFPLGPALRLFGLHIPCGVGHRPLEGSYVIVNWNSRPMLRKDLLAKWVALDERNGGEACPLCGEINAAYAAEEGQVG